MAFVTLDAGGNVTNFCLRGIPSGEQKVEWMEVPDDDPRIAEFNSRPQVREERSIADKLAALGLTLDELRAALK